MSGAEEYRVIPFKGLRGIIARRMHESVTQKPHVTLFSSAGADRLQDCLRQRTAELAGQGVKLTMTGLLLKLVAGALADYPRINGRVENGEIRLYSRVNLGVAVALEEGLTVPVIHGADTKSLAQTASELADLAARARTGKLKPAELMDGTFTVSSLSGYGVGHFTPIINPPEIAILGLGRPDPRLPLSLSFDHAAIDGAQAAAFLQLLAERIEHPDDYLGGEEHGRES